MINPNKMVFKKLTYGDCLKKNRKALIKYIIYKTVDLKIRCIGPFISEIYTRMEIILMSKGNEKLLKIIMNENDEIESIFLKARRHILRMKGIYAPFSDSDLDPDPDTISESEFF